MPRKTEDYEILLPSTPCSGDSKSKYALYCPSGWEIEYDIEIKTDTITECKEALDLLNEQKDRWPVKQDDALEGRHPGKKVNVGFADGHVSREKADGLFVEKTADSYKNLKPLWRPK